MAPRNALYHRYLINRMKLDALTAAQDQTEMANTLSTVETVFDFDDRVVAPQNGFDGALDYYARCSAQAVVEKIQTPTLMVHAATYPWIPVKMYTDRTWKGAHNVSVVIADDGGHVGFHAASLPAPWHDVSIALFFKSQLGA